MGQCTEKQAALLQKHRWYNDGLTYEQASQRIDAIKDNGWKKPASGAGSSRPASAPARTAAAGRPGRPSGGTQTANRTPQETEDGEPTERQVAVLVKFGYEPSDYTYATASRLLDELRENGWKRPDDVAEGGDDLYADDIPFAS